MQSSNQRVVWRDQLRRGLQAMDLALGEIPQQLLLDYLELLQKWNRGFNLTAIRDPEEMVPRQLLDALSILKSVRGPRVLDVGTGPGLPGIPLAIANGDWQVTLLDSNGKKTRFLAQAKLELGLENVSVERCRLEQYRPARPFETITARAFAALPKIVSLTERLLAVNGRILAMKGVLPAEELAQLDREAGHCTVVTLRVPQFQGERHLVIYQPNENHNEQR